MAGRRRTAQVTGSGQARHTDILPLDSVRTALQALSRRVMGAAGLWPMVHTHPTGTHTLSLHTPLTTPHISHISIPPTHTLAHSHTHCIPLQTRVVCGLGRICLPAVNRRRGQSLSFSSRVEDRDVLTADFSFFPFSSLLMGCPHTSQSARDLFS